MGIPTFYPFGPAFPISLLAAQPQITFTLGNFLFNCLFKLSCLHQVLFSRIKMRVSSSQLGWQLKSSSRHLISRSLLTRDTWVRRCLQITLQDFWQTTQLKVLGAASREWTKICLACIPGVVLYFTTLPCYFVQMFSTFLLCHLQMCSASQVQ